MSGFVAMEHLRFGKETIPPGSLVPIEDGRDYGEMLRTGQIERIHPVPTKPEPAAEPKATPRQAHATKRAQKSP